MITFNDNLFSTKVKVFMLDPYLGILLIGILSALATPFP